MADNVPHHPMTAERMVELAKDDGILPPTMVAYSLLSIAQSLIEIKYLLGGKNPRDDEWAEASECGGTADASA